MSDVPENAEVLSAEVVQRALGAKGRTVGDIADVMRSHEALRRRVEEVEAERDAALAVRADAERQVNELIDGLQATRDDWETPIAKAAAYALIQRTKAAELRVQALTEALREWLAAVEAASRHEPGSYRAVAETRGRARSLLAGEAR